MIAPGWPTGKCLSLRALPLGLAKGVATLRARDWGVPMCRLSEFLNHQECEEGALIV
jgi:hypothetical protein